MSSKDYYKERRLVAVTMIVKESSLKERLHAVAQKDGRSDNNWLQHYILPMIEKEVERQEQRVPGRA